MFNRLDAEGTGGLTLDDLVKGAQTDHEFQSRLRVMDIDEADLEQLFDMTLGDKWAGERTCRCFLRRQVCARPPKHPQRSLLWASFWG